MSSLYAVTPGPSGQAMTENDFWKAATSQPFSMAQSAGQSVTEGFLGSPGLGAYTRELQLPDAVPQAVPDGDLGAQMQNPPGYRPTTPDQQQRAAAVQQNQQELQKQYDAQYGALTDEQQKASADFRQNIGIQPGMTAARQAALAEWNDAKEYRARVLDRSNHGLIRFGGNVLGSLTDPVNYIPVIGPEVRAAAVARWGIMGAAGITAADAALNAGLASAATAPVRSSLGDDVSWQAIVSQMSMAALGGAVVGGALHGAGHALDAWNGSRAVNSLENVMKSRAILNEAIDGVVKGEDISLSPAAQTEIARVGDQVAPVRTLAPESGSFNLRHGTFQKPDGLTEFDPNYAGDRWDGSGGTFGKDGVYLDPNGKWTGNYYSPGFTADKSYDVELRSDRMLMLTPDTVELIRKQLSADLTPKNVLKFAKDNGYDTINTHGFDAFADELDKRASDHIVPWDKMTAEEKEVMEAHDRGVYAEKPEMVEGALKAMREEGVPSSIIMEELMRKRGLGDTDLAQDQVFAFDPKRVKVLGRSDGGFEPPKFGKGFVDQLSPRTLDHSAPTTPAAKAAPAALPVERPRVQVGEKPDGWLNQVAQENRDLSDRVGLTGEIEDLFAQGKTLAQVSSEIQPRLDAMKGDPIDGKSFVSGVRATLDIPSRATAEGEVEFQAWKKTYDSRMGAEPAPKAAETTVTINGKTTRMVGGKPVEARRTLDPSQPAATPPDPAVKQAAARIAKPDDLKAVAAEHGVNPETGEFREQYDIEQLRAEGRLRPEDQAELDAADQAFEHGGAWAEALKAAATCVMGAA